MTETTILDQRAVSEIEAQLKTWTTGGRYPASWNTVNALCATVKHLRAKLAMCEGEITAADPGKWGHESKIHLLQSQLEQLRAELNAMRQQPTTPLLMKIIEISDLGSAQEFNDAPERLRSIRGLIIGENV